MRAKARGDNLKKRHNFRSAHSRMTWRHFIDFGFDRHSPKFCRSRWSASTNVLFFFHINPFTRFHPSYSRCSLRGGIASWLINRDGISSVPPDRRRRTVECGTADSASDASCVGVPFVPITRGIAQRRRRAKFASHSSHLRSRLLFHGRPVCARGILPRCTWLEWKDECSRTHEIPRRDSGLSRRRRDAEDSLRLKQISRSSNIVLALRRIYSATSREGTRTRKCVSMGKQRERNVRFFFSFIFRECSDVRCAVGTGRFCASLEKKKKFC